MEAKMFHLKHTKKSLTIYDIQDDSGTPVFQVQCLADRTQGKLQLVNQTGELVLDISPLLNSVQGEHRPTFKFEKDGNLFLTVVRTFGGSRRLEGNGPLGQLVLDCDEVHKRSRGGYWGKWGKEYFGKTNFAEISWKIRDANMNRCGYIRSEDESLLSYSIEVIGNADVYSILGLAVLLAENIELIPYGRLN